MGARPGEPVGIIYGDVRAVQFQFAASDPHVKRHDYVAAEHPGGIALGQVVAAERRSQLSFDEAMSLGRGGPVASGDHISCTVRVVGYRDERGLLQVPRTPFRAGSEVRYATPWLIQKVLGLTVERREGAYVGLLRNTDVPVVLDVNHLVQKHVSILAKTGAGKSYTVGVLLEEMLLRRVPIVVIDPHGEYTTLANPNIEAHEIDTMRRFGVKPKAFHRHITEYTLEEHTGGRPRLALGGEGLEARELVDIMPAKLSPAQVGLLYHAINELKRHRPYHGLKDIVQELVKSPSNAKWPVVSALENLEATQLFTEEGTPLEELVRSGHATLVNLKGTPPDIQEIAVARLARILFEARKRGKVPPFMLVVEEAHNFCPERGLQTAVSGPELKTIASEGRKFGMGLLIVSQRPAKVDKNVLSQCNTQIIMKVTNPNDLRAIGSSVEGLTSEAADEIQRLGTGVALVAGGGLVAPVFVEVRTRMTRHGGRSVNVLVEDEDVDAVGPASTWSPPQEDPTAATGGAWEVDDASPIEAPALGPVEEPEPEPFPLPFDMPTVPLVMSEEDEAPPGPWSPDGPAGLRLELETILEAEPPIVDGEIAPPGPLGAPPEPLASDAVPTPPAREGPGPELRPSDEPEERLLQRVLERLGYTRARSARDAVARIRQAAHALPRLSADEYLRRFGHVGRTYCHPSLPDCGPCPLLDTCRLGQERLGRGEVRRGRWGSRSL